VKGSFELLAEESSPRRKSEALKGSQSQGKSDFGIVLNYRTLLLEEES
jgi:hypothetical protein